MESPNPPKKSAVNFLLYLKAILGFVVALFLGTFIYLLIGNYLVLTSLSLISVLALFLSLSYILSMNLKSHLSLINLLLCIVLASLYPVNQAVIIVFLLLVFEKALRLEL